MLQPEVERKGLSGRFTFNIGENAQAYAMANWYETANHAQFTPLGFNGTADAAASASLPTTTSTFRSMSARAAWARRTAWARVAQRPMAR